MNSRGGTRDQPSIPEARLGPEHAWLGLSIAALTIAVVGLIVEAQAGVVVLRGAYSVLTGLFVSGLVAWKIGAAERRLRREQLDGVCNCDELSQELAELREQVACQRTVYMPAPGRQAGHMHASSAAQSQPIPHQRKSVDGGTTASDPIAAAREAGVEEGFDIGLKVQLADLGVPVLRKHRRPRLTRDS